jgi:hypothetical protein
MFKYKTDAEVQAMTEQEANEYAIAKRAHEEELQTKAIEKALKPVQDDLKKAQDDNTELALKVTKLETEGAKETVKTFTNEVKEKKEEILGLVKGTNQKEVVLKADTVRASISNSASQNKLNTIGQPGTKLRGLYDVFKKVNLGNGDDAGKVVYHDWDEDTTVRAAAMVAEGAAFPESTAKFAKYSIELKKIGDTLPVSEEFGEDEASAAAELEMFVETNVESKVDEQIALGTGVGENLTGLIASVPAYVPVASAISDANIYDLVKKVRTDIVFNRGSKYRPDFVAMNANVIDSLQLKKDANDNYIFPDKSNIGSMIIVEDNNLADNTLVVGDSRYGSIFEKGGLTLSRVYVNAQAIEDMVTIKARKRMLFLVRTVDKTGFRKVTDVNAALVTLATS